MKIKKFLISTAFAFTLFLILISSTASVISAQNASLSSQCAYITNSQNNTVSTTVDTGSDPSTLKQSIDPISPKTVTPVANFRTDSTSGYSPLTVQFTDLSENATEWYWDFGDGTTSTEQNPVHTFYSYGSYFYPPEYPLGEYLVTLTAINGKAKDYKVERITTFSAPEPVSASFISFPAENDPLSVQFQDYSVYGLGAWYNWDFGDGTSSTEANPFHTFPSAGDYTVTLTVTGEWAQSTTSQVVSVTDLKVPIADFSTSPISGVEPLTVKFTDKSTVTTASWYWDFGDGTNSTEQNPAHTYSSAGNYTVNLTVTNENGVNSKYATITVPTATPIYYSGNGHYYEVVSVPGITWEDAKAAAKSLSYSGMNGHLATITSQDENDFIINNIADDNCWWLGGFQPDDIPDSMEPDGNWHWVTEEKWDYTNWPIDRPDNAFSGQNRLALWSEKNWDDASTNDRDHIIGYIIEYEITAPIYNPENGHYYEVKNMPEGITWKDANNASESLSYLGMKGHLATIDSKYENEFIINNLHPNYHWLGGFQPDGSAEPSGGWQWVTGEPWDYTNWDSPEPNEYGNSGEDRLQIYANGYWNDISHSALNTGGYIVEYEEQRPPVANFSADVTKGNVPLSIQFTDLSENATQWNWDFGDGTTSTEQNPTHTYSSAGNYAVNLTVINGKGADSKLTTINVLEQKVLPVSNFTYVIDPSSATVQFIDLSENATEWWWDFGDGLHSKERNPTHAYLIEGDYVVYFPSGQSCIYVSDDELSRAQCIYNYVPLENLRVTLTAMNGNGADYISKQINISSPPEPETRSAHFLSFPIENDPLSVQFIDDSTPSPGIYYWDFGDGATSTEQNPIHIYPSAGNYTVTLRVSGEWAGEASEGVSVTDLKVPVANFSATPICGKSPLTVKFIDKSTGSPVAWKWCFGDGTSSKERNPVHTYCKAGEYNVTLIVNNTEGSNRITKPEFSRVLK